MFQRFRELRGSNSSHASAPGRRRRIAAASAAAAAAVGTAALALALRAEPSTAADPGPMGVILLSWDGARLDLLKQMLHYQPITDTPKMCPSDEDTPARMPKACGDYWSCLPNLCAFEIIESHTISGKTLTRVQHASMLTGAPPQETTIWTNNGSSSVPFGYTIYERLKTLIGGDIDFAHVGSYRYTVRGILGWAAGSIIDNDNIGTRGRPDKFTGLGSNENFLPMLQKFNGKPFFAFEHQKGIDMAGHGVGDQSIQYKVAMIAADDRLKELQDELTRLGMAERTHIFITTDHGFWHTQHLSNVRPVINRTWFASQKDKLLCHTRGNVLDVVPTILDVFGLDPSRSIPKMSGRSLLDRTRVGECEMPVCGDGLVDVGEDCEPSLAVADTCESIGYLGGSLACGADCQYDTSDCADQLESTKLSIDPANSGGFDMELKLGDRGRGGPKFNPTTDAVLVDVYDGDRMIWQGGTENYDPAWRTLGETNQWTAGRGTRPDGLVSVNMSQPERRLKVQISAGGVQSLPEFLSVKNLRTVIRAGQERFDADLSCHVSHDETGLRCEFVMPKSKRHAH